MNLPIPVLFLTDAPDTPSGLGRIGRDLATLVSRLPQYRVGYLGLGGHGSRQLPFVQYKVGVPSGFVGQWADGSIERVWQDFAGRESGVVFTIWDATRLTWFSRPDLITGDAWQLKSFLRAGHFARWGYFPIDATGPSDRLTGLAAASLQGYDRILTYTQWAQGVVERTIGADAAKRRDIDWLPHGINFDTFVPKLRSDSRRLMGSMFHDNDFVVGVVATNQARKDWGLVAATCAKLREKHRRLRLWWHTDLLERYWSIPALLNDYGLASITLVTTHEMDDKTLAHFYSGCDVTLHPGLGEGFGYPIVESMACGVPAIHGNYGGGAEQIPFPDWLVQPQAWRLDGVGDCLRPVYDPQAWADAVEKAVGASPKLCRASVEHLAWARLWPSVWKKWWERGLELL